MDVTASLFLADGRECKIITGIDDHSRFCVIATVVLRATARAVCLALVTAIMIGGQKIQVGLAHARKTAEVSVEADTYQVTVEPGITITAPRTTSRDIRRHKASNYA